MDLRPDREMDASSSHVPRRGSAPPAPSPSALLAAAWGAWGRGNTSQRSDSTGLNSPWGDTRKGRRWGRDQGRAAVLHLLG